jgi:RNA polymerase sigma-70 factor (ECF subfamily)
MKDLSREAQIRDENECIELVKQGHKDEYSVIVQTYMKKAYYIALGFVKREQDAVDVSQDAFIKAYKHIKTFKKGHAFFPWFYKILKNLCLDWLRKRKNTHAVPLEEATCAAKAQFPEELKIRLWNGINQLALEEREIIILRYFQGFSYKEIAQILNKPIGSVMSSLYYAKKKLRSKVGEHLK